MPDASQLPEGYAASDHREKPTYFQGVYDGARSIEDSLTAKITLAHTEAHDAQVRLSCDNQLLESTLHIGRVQAFKEVLDVLAPPPEPTPGVKNTGIQPEISELRRQRDDALTELERVRAEMQQDKVDRLEDEDEQRRIVDDNEQAANLLRTARRWIDRAEHKLSGVDPDDVTREIE